MARRLVGIINCLMLLMGACAEKTTVSYYRHVDFSGVHNITLKYPFSPDTTLPDYYFKVSFDDKERIKILEFPAIGGKGTDPAVGYSAIWMSYSKDAEKWLYLDSNGHPTVNDKGIYSELYELDRRGFLKSRANLDAQGKIAEDSSGVAIYLLTCDDRGLVTERLGLNIEGDTIIDKEGNYRIHYVFDENGFLIEEANYGEGGALAEATDGVTITRFKYDSLGNVIEESYCDSLMNPRENHDSKVAKVEYSYDEAGRVIEYRYFDASGELAVGADRGYPILRISYWENGNYSEFKVCGADESVLRTSKFTPGGIKTEDRFFDSQGNPVVDSAEGYATYRVEFDDRGNMIEENYFNEKMRPIFPKSFSFASVRSEFNTRNNRTKCSWYDADGNLCENKHLSCAIVNYKYDYQKGIVTETCLDTDGVPQECVHGYAVRQIKYDGAGNIMEDKYFDKAGNLITDARFDEDGGRLD